MNGLIDLLSKLGPARLAAMGAVTVALIGFFAMIAMRMTQPVMGVLYSDLTMEDSASIVRDLDQRAVKYEIRDDGRTIAAPKADIAKLRMDLASKGMPSGGSVGYEIFDKGDSFSATSFVQGVNALRALEGELARTIRSISRVQSARVHLVLPERRLFERDREPPRASIVLKVSGELDAGQVRAIRHLVASAVDGLKPERISIVDERGRLLADGAASDQTASAALDDKQLGHERRIKAQVEDILASIVGQGRSRVQVAVELDTKKVQQTTESFDPEGRVVRSTQTRNESQTTTEQNGQVTVGNELPAAQGGQGGAGPRDASGKNEEVVNYEISKTTRTELIDGGQLRRLSVAVLVDGVYTRDAGGQATYAPRPPEELQRLSALVRSAIGFDAKRGDQVEVVNLRFVEAPPTPDTAAPASLFASFTPTRDDIMRGVELFVLSVLSLIVLLVVVRPMVRTILAPIVASSPNAASRAISAGEPVQLPGIEGPVPDSETSRMMDIARVNGQVQAKSIEKIGDMVKENPVATATIVRQWIHEGA